MLVSYDKATRLDRSSSTVVVRQYVDAKFVGDDNRASLFSCRAPHLGLIDELQDQLEALDRERGTVTQVIITAIQSFEHGRRVAVDLELNQGNGVEVRTRLQRWQFALEDEDGWRVCSAERLPDPSPTPSATPPTAS